MNKIHELFCYREKSESWTECRLNISLPKEIINKRSFYKKKKPPSNLLTVSWNGILYSKMCNKKNIIKLILLSI